jgi:pimeloyl-ACP methyl ester carboxylesterase
MKIALKILKSLSERTFKRFLKFPREHGIPPWPHTWETRYASRDGIALLGWAHRPPRATQGTVFLLHGFTTNCGNLNCWRWAESISARCSTVVCAVDFRHHGKSGDAVPTFGTAECWDVQATLDEADKYNSPKPYVLVGESLGAMAAQLTAIQDPRVAGAVLLHPPGWAWDAIGKCVTAVVRGNLPPLIWKLDSVLVRAIGGLINSAYGGRNVVGEGDST